MTIEWRSIKDYPEYEISKTGIIRKRILNSVSKRYKYHYLKRRKPHNGNYRIVGLKDPNTKRFKCISIHKLILESFIGPCPYGHEAHYKDGIKYHDTLENLEWATPSEKRKHSFKIGTISHRGEKHPNAKLTNRDVKKIRHMHEHGITMTNLGKQYGVTHSAISNIISRKSWSHI